jgi:deoxyguanosine kinase
LIPRNFIVIEGNIGAGKTTLVNKLAGDFNARKILERFAENPFLPKFYEDRERYSFQLELSFLADRYNQMMEEVASPELFTSFTISDYYFMKSLIFARQTLSRDEYKLYRQLFDIIYKSIPKPDLYVYLHLTPDNLITNIRQRGRGYEKVIDTEYLKSIQDGYFEFFRSHELKFLIIDTNHIDFVSNKDHYRMLTEAILFKDYPSGMNRLVF